MAQDRALSLVRDKRQSDEEKALEEWTFSKNQVASYEDQIKQVEEFRVSYIRDMETEGRNGFTGTKLLAYQAFIEKLDNIAAKQKVELERLKMLVEQKRQIYLTKQKERKIIESLLEKHKIKRLKAEQKAEQKLLDEFAVVKYARRNQSENFVADDYNDSESY